MTLFFVAAFLLVMGFLGTILTREDLVSTEEDPLEHDYNNGKQVEDEYTPDNSLDHFAMRHGAKDGEPFEFSQEAFSLWYKNSYEAKRWRDEEKRGKWRLY